MSTRKLLRYLEAHEEYLCYQRQRAQYPELLHSPKHAREYIEAKAAWLKLLAGLTGGELAVARETERYRLKQREETDADASR